MGELQQKILLVATMGDVPDAARDVMPILPCHTDLLLCAYVGMEIQINASTGYNFIFALKNQRICSL